jgi:hypothetical protein
MAGGITQQRLESNIWGATALLRGMIDAGNCLDTL